MARTLEEIDGVVSDLQQSVNDLSTELSTELKNLTEMVKPITDFFISTKMANMMLKWTLAILVSLSAICYSIKYTFFH